MAKDGQNFPPMKPLRIFVFCVRRMALSSMVIVNEISTNENSVNFHSTTWSQHEAVLYCTLKKIKSMVVNPISTRENLANFHEILYRDTKFRERASLLLEILRESCETKFHKPP
jgi:hypothetical protein